MLTVDGESCVAPCTFQWVVGTNHVVAVNAATQAGATGIQYVFSGWQDGGTASHSILTPAAALTLTATFTTQYYLTTAASPAAGGTVSPPSGWYNSGAVITVGAVTNNGYQFSGLSGSSSGVAVPQSLTLNGPATVTANFTPVVNLAGWYDVFSTRRKITVNHTKVTGSLSNFPILVSLTDAELRSVSRGGRVGTTNGADIAFTASDGSTKLNHELESYDASSGAVVAWVQIPSLSSSADTSFYLYYGKSAAADQQNKTNVWDSAYRIVNHFKDAAGPVTDPHGTGIPPQPAAALRSWRQVSPVRPTRSTASLVSLPFLTTHPGTVPSPVIQSSSGSNQGC